MSEESEFTGFDAHMTKPIDPEQLYTFLSER
jgi:hypothetical protein